MMLATTFPQTRELPQNEMDTAQTTPSVSTPLSADKRPKFPPDPGFQAELRRRVDEYFKSTGKSERDVFAMYLKTAIILLWFAASYILLVFLVTTWWEAVFAAISLGFATAAIGFNIQHDGGHGAYSKYSWINKLAAMTMDMVGGSSYLWHFKHGIYHHTYTNITGLDTDIDLGKVARLSPHQKRRPHHRWQHFYLWPLYGIMAIRWQLYGDFYDAVTGTVGVHRIPRPKGWDLVVFLGGKIVMLCLAFVIPLIWHSWWVVLLFYILVTAVVGVVLSIVFQLAHCVEEADFLMPVDSTMRMENPWAIHQVRSTVDFARKSRVLAWFLGGLNFQIEHHLFPRICHVHYPALSQIVEQTCKEFGVRYSVHKTFRAGMASHFRWMRRMGQPEPPKESNPQGTPIASLM